MSTMLSNHLHGPQTGRAAASSCDLMVGIVTLTNDPEHMGRVKVRIPSENNRVSGWARIAAPMAGNDRGCYFPPQSEDEVLVLRAGPDYFVLGALWNGKDKTPADNRDGENNVRVIKSRSGHVIRFNDTEGKESLEIVDGSLRNQIVIDMANDTVTITSGKDIDLSAPSGKITLSAQTIDIGGANGVTIHAPRVDIN